MACCAPSAGRCPRLRAHAQPPRAVVLVTSAVLPSMGPQDTALRGGPAQSSPELGVAVLGSAGQTRAGLDWIWVGRLLKEIRGLGSPEDPEPQLMKYLFVNKSNQIRKTLPHSI